MFIPQESYNSIKKKDFNVDTTLLIKDKQCLPVMNKKVHLFASLSFHCLEYFQ